MSTPLTDDQRRRIVAALDREDLSDLSLLERLRSPIEFYYFVTHYNWDSGIESIESVLDRPECDFGTGLLAYWLSGPLNCHYGSVVDCPDYDLAGYGVIAKLERRLCEGDFSSKRIRVDPRNLLGDGEDFTTAELPRQPPAPLEQPSPGDPLPEGDLAFEMTAEEKALASRRYEKECLEAEHARLTAESALTLHERSQEERCYDDQALESLREQANANPEFLPNLRAFEVHYRAKWRTIGS